MELRERVENQYIAHWGEPTRRAGFEVDGLEIGVVKWDADANPEGVTLYATVGASAYPGVNGPDTHRAEFILGLSSARDDVASALGALGLYPTRHRVALDHGHTVPAGGPLWVGAAMQTFLVARPRHGFLPALELPDGLHVEFLQAIPIFESERAFKVARDADALIASWEEAAVPFWDPERSPCPS